MSLGTSDGRCQGMGVLRKRVNEIPSNASSSTLFPLTNPTIHSVTDNTIFYIRRNHNDQYIRLFCPLLNMREVMIYNQYLYFCIVSSFGCLR